MRDQRKLKRQKTKVFRKYYRGNYFGLSCSGVAFRLAETLNRNNKDTLWWWCIGLADFTVHGKNNGSRVFSEEMNIANHAVARSFPSVGNREAEQHNEEEL